MNKRPSTKPRSGLHSEATVRPENSSAGGESTPSAYGLRRRLASNRIWIFAIPFFCVLGIAVAIYYFLIIDRTTGSSGIAPLTNLLLLADEDLRYPLEAPDVAHESGALGRFERRYGVRVRVEYGAPTELFKQLQDGWRGDLYLTGDGASMNRAREAGLVAEDRPIARRVPVTEMIDIPGVENEMGAVRVAVLAQSRNQRAAAQLVRFFSGSASHEIFEMYGFDVGVNQEDNNGGRR
jgi:hypothetical protein